MLRILASLSVAALLAAPAFGQQCLQTTSLGTGLGISGDDTTSGHVALGLTYPNPFGGALAGGYTHVQVSTNGWAMLTDGTLATGLPATSSYGSTADTNAGLGGGVGGQPLLCPWWGDGNLYLANSPDIYVKASTGPGVPAEITWLNHSDFGNSTNKKNFKVRIHDSGVVQFQYSSTFVQTGGSNRYVGVSAVATSPINTPYGVFTSIVVSHNGVITLGGTPNTTSFTVSGATFAGHSAGTAFYTWYDWNDAETGSGTIKTEEVGGTLYVTWDNVESFQFPAIADPSTFQYQIDLATGSVNMVWSSISTVGYANRNCIVGFHGKTASPNPGSVDLSTALPIIQTKNVDRMTLAVNPLPGLVQPSGDSVPLTWTVTNVPEASHIFPLARACNIVFSIGPAFVAGYDLGPAGVNIGAPGCSGYVLTADAFLDVSTVSPIGTCTSGALTVPGTPSIIGLVLTTQAIAVLPPGIYNGNVNDIGGGNGLVTSNAVQQTYNLL